MSRLQLTVIGICVVIASFLFAKGYKSTSRKVEVHAPAPNIQVFDIDAYRIEKIAELPTDLQESAQKLADDATPEALKSLVLLWDSVDAKMAAYTFAEYVKLVPEENNYYILGTKFLNLIPTAKDSVDALMLASEAKKNFQKVLDLNSLNLDAKVALATCIIEFEGAVMQGVTMLREVTSADSNHIQANFTLGMLSIRSNQFDKAISRFQKLITLQPFNPEYYYYLGESYAKSGDTQNAVRAYEKCKTLLPDKASKQEVENIISQLKNI